MTKLIASTTNKVTAGNMTRHDIVLDAGTAEIEVNGVNKGSVTADSVFNFSYAGNFTVVTDASGVGHVISSKG